MKKIIILFSALFLIAGLASAQSADSTHHKGFGGRKMAMYRHHGFDGRKLNLTDEQKGQMKTVNDNYHQQLKTLQGNNSITMGEYKTQLAALQKTRKEQTGNIFTDEQKKMIADNKAKLKTRMQARGAAGFDKMKQNLALSDDQVAKLKTQREELHTKMQTLHNDNTLMPEQKRAQMKELFAQQKEQMKTVLTSDQLSKLQSMHKQRFGNRHGGGSNSQQEAK